MKQRIQILFEQKNIRYTLLNLVYSIFLFSLLVRFTIQLLASYDFEGWDFSEWLINYEGGFVRRGLTGEILFFFVRNLNVDLEWAIKIFCLFCFIVVAVFFVKSFMKKGYSLYILPLHFFLGAHVVDWVYWYKRDHLMFILLILTLYGFSKIKKQSFRILIINLLLGVGLLVHEAFFFFSVPFLFLLFFENYKNKGIIKSILLAILSLSPTLIIFFITVIFHGDLETAQSIWNSWVDVSNLQAASLTEHSHGALSSIGWSSKWAFRMHFAKNFLSVDLWVSSLLFWCVSLPTIYYIVTNALFVFRKNKNIFSNTDKTLLSAILLFQFIFLIPMFTILSCDMGRIIFYWIASSFAIFLLIPKEKIIKLFPVPIIKHVIRINKGMTNIMYPTKSNITLLMLFTGAPIVGFTVINTIKTSVIFNVFQILSGILIKLKVIEALQFIFDLIF